VENLLSIPDHPVKIARKHNLCITLRENLPESLPVFDKLLPLPLNLCNNLTLSNHFSENFIIEHLSHESFIRRVKLELALKTVVAECDSFNALELNMLPCQPVFTISELDDLSHTVPHSSIIVNHASLHSLDQPTLYITCLSSLHSRINQTLSSSHSMEIELARCQPS